MTPSQLIAKKRDGGMLSAAEIATFIGGYVSGEIHDYQMSAMAMAIYLRGMDGAETAALTEEMLRSGITLAWPAEPPKVDKHSTGGIGDKSSLILAPLLACCGLQVPMISGRGLGATGGTLDKLESITGFRTDLSTAELQAVVERVGCVITGATADLVPADRKLYALRDVTATVASIPLITASIMSKKLAEGLTALVLDVKFGSGAFMKTLDQARALARSLVDTGERMGVRTTALVTDMNQPNGQLIGNAVEVEESLTALTGGGPDDLMEIILALGSELLISTGQAASADESRRVLTDHLASGRALEKFQQMVAAQGGSLNAPRPVARHTDDAVAERAGYVSYNDAERLGLAIIALGGGRKKLGDKLDLSVGLRMLVRLGDFVDRGQPLVNILADEDAAAGVVPLLESAITIAETPFVAGPLIVERITTG